ncbi:hypothetical protein M9Y10_020918 [Tritrichomonas musculus]|uniref:HAD family phosphatase n=1 Tax=Tritrichomonas musculus TaxID=1915356 RepID=A0ABR2HEZ6_9EUKA
MNPKIKTIIFDVGGVLIDIDFKKSIDALRKAGFKDIDKKIHEISSDDHFTQYRLGLISTEEFRNFIRKEIDKDLTDEEIDSMWNQMLIGIPHEKLDLLIELHKKYTIYALSNTNELHWQCSCNMFNYQGLNINNFFDNIFLSFKMHKDKPDSDIFEEVIKETKLIPNESLFIDDSETNCNAASSLGIHAYHYHIGEDLNIIKTLL